MEEIKDQIMFTRGNPAEEALPVKELSECAASIFEKEGKVLFQYGHYSGYAPLREWIADYYGADYEQILIGNGSMEFFSFGASVLLEEGDAVFLEYPSYDRAVKAMKRAGADVVGISLEKDGVDIDAFEREVEKKRPKLFYTVADFQNPTGVSTSLEKRKRIVELAKKYGFYIIEDGPYRPLRYYGEDITSYRELLPEQVIFISSFSKTVSPGMRVGFMIGPKEIMPKFHKWSEDTYIHPSLVTEGIIYEYCRRGLFEPNIEKLKDLYRPRLDGILHALETHMDRSVSWIKPEGGFFVSVNLPENVDGNALQNSSKEFGFVVARGNGFFVDGKGDRFIRLPFCQMDPSEAEEGIKRLAKAVRSFSS
ncbi:MAG: PLP-dependent aminotransferase family protein [Spirochaetaceae bacterium]